MDFLITLENIDETLSKMWEAANPLVRDKLEYAMSPATTEVFAAYFSLKTGDKLVECAHYTFRGRRIHEVHGMPDNTILFTMPEEITSIAKPADPIPDGIQISKDGNEIRFLGGVLSYSTSVNYLDRLDYFELTGRQTKSIYEVMKKYFENQ